MPNRRPLLTVIEARAAIGGFCGFLVGIGLGRFGYPPLIPAMIEGGWASVAGAYSAGTLLLAGYVIGAVLANPMIHRLGLRTTIYVAALLIVWACASSVVALPEPVFSALRGLTGLGGGLLTIALPPAFTSMAPAESRARVGGVAFAGVGAGFVLSGTLVPALALIGLEAAWGGITALVAAAAIVCLLTLRMTPQRIADEQPHVTVGRIRSRAFLGLALLYGAVALGNTPTTVFLVDHVARTLDHGLTIGGAVWVAMGGAAVVGPLLSGFLVERVGFAHSIRIACAAMGAATLTAGLTNDAIAVGACGMIVLGFLMAYGAFVAGRVREIVGPRAFTQAWALLTVIAGIGQAASTGAFGVLKAMPGGALLMFLIAATLFFAGLAIEIAMARSARQPVDQPLRPEPS
jgi:predicted MFS family arabinose efflux permease